MRLYTIFLTIWNYLTPVFYSIEILPAKLQTLMQFNPLYQFINSARSIVLYGQAPSITNLVLLAVIGIGMLLIGSYVFKKNQDKYIYYI